MYLQWTDDLRVGVSVIDAQHRRLVDLVNELHDAMLQGQGSAVLGRTIRALVDYTVTHFGTEERYFAQYAYPAAASHLAQHAAFVEQVEDFKRGFDEGRLMMSLDVLDFLGNWLVEHIQGSDRAFAPYLNERGVA